MASVAWNGVKLSYTTEAGGQEWAKFRLVVYVDGRFRHVDRWHVRCPPAALPEVFYI